MIFYYHFLVYQQYEQKGMSVFVLYNNYINPCVVAWHISVCCG